MRHYRYFISQLLFRRFPTNLLVRLLGQWSDGQQNQSRATAGLAYLLSPPRRFVEFVEDPFHVLFYVAFMLTSCALFSKVWIEVSGQAARDVATELESRRMFVRGGNKKSTEKLLNHYIPTAATFGGMCIGGLTVFADFLGAIGSGTGILLAVTIVYGYIESFNKARSEGGIGFLNM